MISPVAAVIVLFVILPLLLGLRARYLDRRNVRAAIRKAKPLAMRLKEADTESLISVAIWGVAILLYVLGALLLIGVTQVKSVGVAVLAFFVIAPVVLFVVKFRVVAFVKANYPWLKWVASLVAIVVAIFASIYADALIVGATHSRAENFPAAQRVFTVIGSLLVYYYILIFVGFGVYLWQVIHVAVRFFMSHQGSQEWVRGIRLVLRRLPSRGVVKKLNMLNEVAMLIASAFFVLVLIEPSQKYLDQQAINTRAQEILIFSSFHASPTDCGLGDDENMSVSILPFGKMVTATRLESGAYDFKSGVCKER